MASGALEITYRKALPGGYAVLRVAGGPSFEAEPGQFVMIRGDWGFSPFLPRPFSLAAVESGEITLLLRVVGEGSRRLAAVQRGDKIQIHGPLGKPFRPAADGEHLLLVGGGVGIAPLLFLARRTGRRGGQSVTVLYGGRTRRDLPLATELASAAAQVTFTTEDGSAGETGLVTDAVTSLVGRTTFDRIVACGPWPMMAAVARIAAQVGVACEVSLENMMACGYGVCLGCAVRASGGGFVYACSDGPVVDARVVDWETGEPFIPLSAPRAVRKAAEPASRSGAGKPGVSPTEAQTQPKAGNLSAEGSPSSKPGSASVEAAAPPKPPKPREGAPK